MFTGIVEAMSTVLDVTVPETDAPPGREDRRVVLRRPPMFAELSPGDSIAVDGACLTAVEVGADRFAVDVIGTTLSRTIAGAYREGSRVNLERAMRLSDRLDGHLVQGHVDGRGELLGRERRGDHWLLDFRIPRQIQEGCIPRGSITLNGVSLTVNTLTDPDTCQVGIIPHTWKVTNLSLLEIGDSVNVEGDLIGKYVGRILAARTAQP